MARKDKSFAAKLGVNREDERKHCAKCGEMLSFIQVVDSERGNNDAWKFKERYVGVCKCNQKEVYG
ncbi:hypothetical protein GF337_16795 [candidate division KSB1 bacterium]|nr:hypothetical protein [candidate division KSB1 bacterium]